MNTVDARLAAGVAVAERLLAAVNQTVDRKVCRDGTLDRALLDEHQRIAHGLTWFATYTEVLRAMQEWAQVLSGRGEFGEAESCIATVLLDEYLFQLQGGIAMSQGEFIRPEDFELPAETLAPLAALTCQVSSEQRRSQRAHLAKLLAESHGRATFERTALDADLDMLRDRFNEFVNVEVSPHAQRWHLSDSLIPVTLIEQLAELGVFGLSVPEEFGGAGMSKLATCVVSEELSRGYLGVGSLGTRSEIAAELILRGGTREQQERWLPDIASGAKIPTAVFTEPNSGSDLASLRTRAIRERDQYLVTGNKTWITHAARADLMFMLVRTDSANTDHRGLSILIAEKPRGTDAQPFPSPGMSGGEIPVLGYRGMKEYEIRFDDYVVPARNLLGGSVGYGFAQLMTTFEAARIQTAARAVGVAQAALEAGISYAGSRSQFGQPIIAFPRIHDKLAIAAAEIAAARQLTYRAARRKDGGARCDLEAGMAKLLAARVAWSTADNVLQIHGGNGFAMECSASRLLCDARVLSIFEGAAEIQADVIARRLLAAEA